MTGKRLTINVSRWPVRAQLVYLLLVVLLPVFSVLGWHLFSERRHAAEQARISVTTTSGQISAAIVQFLADKQAAMSRLADRPLVRAMDGGRCDPLIGEYVALHPEFGDLVLADLQGQAVCTAAAPSATASAQPAVSRPTALQPLPPWGKEAQGSGAFIPGNAFFSPADSRWAVGLAQPVRSGDGGSIAGVLLLDVDLLLLSRRLLAALPAGVRVEVRDAAQRTMLRSEQPEAFIGRVMASAVPGAADADQGQTAQRVTAAAPVPATGWTVEASISEDDAFQRANTQLGRAIAAGLALLFVAALLAWRISLRIVRPIEDLAQVATRVAAGDSGARAREDEGPAEIEAVAQQVNQMLAAQASHEQVLANREHMFRSMFHNNPVPHILQIAYAAIVDVNDAFLAVSGYARDELVGRTIREVGLLDNRAEGERAVAELRSAGRLDAFETIGRTRNGDPRFFLVSACSLQIDGVPHFLHSIIDITARRRAEEALREREQRLSFLLSRTSAVIYTSRAHGDFGATFVSESVQGLLGYQPEELMADAAFWSNNLHPDDMAGFAAAKPRLFVNDMVVHEYRLRHHDGDYRWIHDEIRLYRDARGEPDELIGFWIDVTQRKEAERRVQENEARFRTLTELSADWYWEQDAQFRFIRTDASPQGPTGSTSEARMGMTHWDSEALNLNELDWEQHRATLAAHREFRDFEISRIESDGRIRWIAISGTPFFDEKGVFGGYRGVGRDITARKQAAEKIHQLAYFDALTGLPNRRRLTEQLRRSLQLKARSHRHGAVLFIDLDNFKSLNDTQGHDMGDALLQQVAQRLSDSVREVDTVARLGGDEFVLVLDDLSDNLQVAVAQAESLGQKILQTLGQVYDLTGREHRSTPSIGVTVFGENARGVEELLKQADLAMYQAKSAGRNTLRFFDVGMQASVDRRVAMEIDLRRGLAREELALHFQPVVLSDGRVVGAEALARWNSPQRGSVSPGEFIPLAEATGLILPLGAWVLRSACAQLATWSLEPALAQLTLAVNVSAHQFREPGFVAQVLLALEQSGANPSRLKIELTESLLAHSVGDIVAKMIALKAKGVGFSLDDFGTGYSSLSYLKKLPLDQLKIDQSFVRDVLTDANDAAIARTILALGDSLGLDVVAEGVETEGQREFLEAHGCHSYQGYLFSRPLPIGGFNAFVLARG